MGPIKTFDKMSSQSNETCSSILSQNFAKFSISLFEGLFLGLSLLTLLCLAKQMFSIVEESSTNDNENLELSGLSLKNYTLNSLGIESVSIQLQDLCPICYETFDETREVSMIRNCKHIYHKDCIISWFQKNLNCPICRGKLDQPK